jgi:hypothetical protein
LYGMHPFLKKLFADAAYQGPDFHRVLAKILPNLRAGPQSRDRLAALLRWIMVDHAASWICAGAGASPRASFGPGGAICIA